MRSRSGTSAVEERPADHLVHRVVAADVLADADGSPDWSKSPVAWRPPVRSNAGLAQVVREAGEHIALDLRPVG